MDVISVLDRYKLITDDMKFYSGNIKITCPFHLESEASFNINLNTGNYYCFGCGESGTIIKLITKLENCNDLKALMILNKYNKDKDKVKNFTPLSYKEYLEGAYIQYASLPTPKIKELNYLFRRGFNINTIRKFDIKIESSIDYPILIPIFENGKYKGNLRRRTDSIEERKYLNSKGFRKKQTLGGKYLKGIVLVVEGYFDMMKAQQYKYNNSCCIFGCIPSEAQIKKLKKVTDTIITGLDNTPRGKEGNKIFSKYFKVKKFKYQYNLKDIGDINSQYVFNKCLYDTL